MDARVADPADDLAWLAAAAPQDVLDSIFEAYVVGRRELRDPHLLDRARLASELALLRWLMYGVRTENADVISDGEGMMLDLEALLFDTPPADEPPADRRLLVRDQLFQLVARQQALPAARSGPLPRNRTPHRRPRARAPSTPPRQADTRRAAPRARPSRRHRWAAAQTSSPRPSRVPARAPAQRPRRCASESRAPRAAVLRPLRHRLACDRAHSDASQMRLSSARFVVAILVRAQVVRLDQRHLAVVRLDPRVQG